MIYDTIFLVDDNPIALFYNKDIVLEFNNKTNIITFESSLEFLKEYAANYSNTNSTLLLLLDINMPNKNGFEVLEELEKTNSDAINLDVIMVTSSNQKFDIERASRFSNVLGYIEKPLTLSKFIKTLKGEI